jgi:hypothetical protein
MESVDVNFCVFTSARGHNGATLMVHVEHERSGFFFAVAKHLLQNKGDVRHEIDWVVPHKDNPWPVDVGVFSRVAFDIAMREHLGFAHPHIVPRYQFK